MIFITGATSGIGEACARLLASKGLELFLLGRRLERLEKLQQEISIKKSQIEVAQLDITAKKDIDSFCREYADQLSRCDVLVNNAGLALGLKNFDQVLEDEWDKMIDTNLKGTIKMTSLVLPFMIKKNQGHIINMGSVAGHHVYPKGNIYCATKHAIHAFSQSLRVDLVGKNIRVSEVSPGMVETEFSQVRLGDKDKAKDVYKGMNPLVAQDIAEIIFWILQRPKHVNIEEVVVYPTDQASPTLVHRA